MNTTILPQIPVQHPSVATLAQRAGATRSRRHAAGRYPSTAQKDALCVANSRGGRKLLTLAQLQALASHPHLAASQRAEFAQLAANAA